MMLILDAMDAPGQWSALAPDGVTVSTELLLSSDATHFRYGADQRSGRITGSTNAMQHRLRRSLANLDLNPYEEIRFWVWSNRPADGSPERPFFLEARMGSAALPIEAAGNTWRRAVPVSQVSSWELVRLTLGDLPAGVRGAANSMELRCLDARQAFVCHLDDLAAVRERMIGDVDEALLARLHQQLSVDGNLVRAVLAHPEHPPTTVEPYMLLRQYDLQYDSERTRTVRERGDYSGGGYWLRAVSVAYNIYYAVDVVTATRLQKTQVMEFILAQLSPTAGLLVNNVLLTVDWVAVSPFEGAEPWRSGRSLLYFKVGTRQELGRPERVQALRQIQLEVEPKS